MVELRGERVAVGHAMSRKTQNTRSSRLKTLEPPGGLGSVPSPANSCYCRILLELGFSGTRSVLPMETNGSSSFIQITGNQILLLSLSLSVQVTGHVSEALLRDIHIVWSRRLPESLSYLLRLQYNTYSFGAVFLGKVVEMENGEKI